MKISRNVLFLEISKFQIFMMANQTSNTKPNFTEDNITYNEIICPVISLISKKVGYQSMSFPNVCVWSSRTRKLHAKCEISLHFLASIQQTTRFKTPLIFNLHLLTVVRNWIIHCSILLKPVKNMLKSLLKRTNC